MQQVPLKIELRDMLSEKPQELRALCRAADDGDVARRMTVTIRRREFSRSQETFNVQLNG